MGKKSKDYRGLMWLFQHSKGQRLRIIFLTIGNALFAASSIWFALICKDLIDCAINRDLPGLYTQIAALLGVIILQLVLRLGCNSMAEYVRCKLDIQMKQHMLHVILKKDYQDISEFHSGELQNRLFSDIQITTDGITGILPNLINLITRLVMAIGVMIAMDWRFTFVFLVAGVSVFLVTILFRKRMKNLHKAVQEQQGKVRSLLQEILEGLLIIKVFGIEERMEENTAHSQDDFFRIQMKRRSFSIAANAGVQLVFRLGYLYALCWGGFGLYHQTLTYGTLTAVLQMVGQIQTPFSSLSGLLPRIYSMIASAERLIELEELKDETATEVLDCVKTYENLDSIEFKDINFSYGRTPVLHDTNFRIQKGDFVAITGLSGGGKSTMFLLMLGAYHPSEGHIYLHMRNKDDGLEAGIESRRLFAYVPQGNHLFSGTIRENVSMLHPDATEEEIWWALKTACAESFVRELPELLDTAVGERGFGFSEGQVQRIAIARALLGGAPILLLDEATSALDEPTEAQLLQNIAELKEKTCFIVTHRKAALKICNREIRLTDGQAEDVSR